MSQELHKILIVEDDLDVADMLNAYLRIHGYEVYTAPRGEDAIQICIIEHPDLVILDIRLPDIDGYEVAHRLRTNRRTEDIPIIFMTQRHDRADRLQGLGMGADDFITKPFDIQEMRLRVRNALQRANQDTLTNPVTGLPDGKLVDEHLVACLQSSTWSLIFLEIINLDAFRETYGFVASDDVLRAISLMIHNIMHDLAGPGDFLGHLDTTEFILLTTPDRLSGLKDRIRTRLEQSLDYFYPIKDRERSTREEMRLAIKICDVYPSDGPFESLEVFKSSLCSKKT
ncbi:MAG: response regulator [Chloroflexota bacterium]